MSRSKSLDFNKRLVYYDLNWSGRVDSNHRPPGPEPGALARLSHAPNSIAGNPGAGGSEAPQRASAPRHQLRVQYNTRLGLPYWARGSTRVFREYGSIPSSAARKTAPGTIGGVAGTKARCLLNGRKQRGCHGALRNARVGLRMRPTHTARSRAAFRLAGSARLGRAVDPSAGLIRDFDVRFLRSSRFRMP